jgi:NADH dehydrogenase
MTNPTAPPAEDRTPAPVGGAAHVVIVGAGFGGLSCARGLGRSGHRVTVIDQRNYHLFTPLLYQVATAALSPADVTAVVRNVMAPYRNVDTVYGTVVGVERAARRLKLTDGGYVPYDVLILATGSVFDYFGNDGWAKAAPGVKTIDNARTIRARLLRAFELAEVEEDPDVRRRLLTIVVVGGGPTGVEMAGAVAELARFTLAKDFRRIDPKALRVILIEAGSKLLASFPQTLSRYAVGALDQLGIEIRLNAKVETIEDGVVIAGGERIETGAIVWAAGVRAAAGAEWLGVEADKKGRIPVAADLTVKGLQRIYAIGDLARVDEGGDALPALAQVATQQGKHLARELARCSAWALKSGAPALAPFHYASRGDTAVIGRAAAVLTIGSFNLKGRLAWFAWGLIHIVLLIGFANRVMVSIQWLLRYFNPERGARLID